MSFIDRLIDSTLKYKHFSFINIYSSYYKILMFWENDEKTSFIIKNHLYYYVVMLFGLIIASVIYQWLIIKMFYSQHVRNIEIYVDDIVINSKKPLIIRQTYEKSLTSFVFNTWSLILTSVPLGCLKVNFFGLHDFSLHNKSKPT